MDSLKVLLFPIPLGKHAEWIEWVVTGSLPMSAVVGIHEFSFGQNKVLCRGSRGGWLLEILSMLRHRKEFQFQECVIDFVKAAQQYRSWQPV